MLLASFPGSYKQSGNVASMLLNGCRCKHVMNTDLLQSCSHAVPETAPLNLSVQATDSQTLVLSWEAPLPEDRNGIITQYTVNITEMETGILLQLATNNTTVTAFSLHPHYTYSCTVAAETSIGLGPYTTPSAVQMPEDGK